jgi:hypothetical protein
MAKMMDPRPIEDARDVVGGEAVPSSGELLRTALRDHVHQLRRLPVLARESASGIRRVRSRVRER